MVVRVDASAWFSSAEFRSIKHHAVHAGTPHAGRGRVIAGLPFLPSIDPAWIEPAWYGKPRERLFGACMLRLTAPVRTMLVRLSAWDIRWNGGRFAVPHALR